MSIITGGTLDTTRPHETTAGDQKVKREIFIPRGDFVGQLRHAALQVTDIRFACTVHAPRTNAKHIGGYS